jgi:hypothetical protein
MAIYYSGTFYFSGIFLFFGNFFIFREFFYISGTFFDERDSFLAKSNKEEKASFCVE